MRIVHFILLMFVGSGPLAWAKNSSDTYKSKDQSCTFESITNNCFLFHPSNGEKIVLPDGTIIPNFSAIYKVSEEKKLSAEMVKEHDKAAKDSDQLLNLKFSVASILSETDDSRMHPWFRFYIVENYPPILKAIFGAADAPPALRMPWPPEQPLVEFKTLKARDVSLTMNILLTPDQLGRLKEVLTRTEGAVENASSGDKLRDLGDVTPARQAYIAKMVKFSKEAIAGIILQGRSFDKVTDAERNAILKVKSVAFNDPFNEKTRLRVRMHPVCRGPIPNAFYDASDHSISLCPTLYRFPDSTIVSVVAHELGHAIDPCNSQFPTYQVNLTALEKMKTNKGGQQLRELASDNRKFAMFSFLSALPKSDITMTSTQMPLLLGQNIPDYFEKAGVIQPVAKGVPFSKYVLKDIYGCLKDRGFKALQAEEIRDIAKEVVELRRQFKDQTYSPLADERKIVSAFNAYPECTGIERHSQMGEATADWISSKVLGVFLKGMQLENYLERLGPIAFFGNLVCLERFKFQEEKEGALGETMVGAWMDYARAHDSHPADRDRIEKIFLAERDIRHALGCKEEPQLACEHVPAR